MIPSPCQIICHTSIHDPWSMDNRQYWKLTFLTKIGDHRLLHDLLSNSAWVELAAKLQDGLWQSRTVKSQSITVLFFLEMENVFQEFFQKKSGRLDSGFLKHFHPLSTVLLCPPFQEYFLLIWSLDLQTVTYISSYRSKWFAAEISLNCSSLHLTATECNN